MPAVAAITRSSNLPCCRDPTNTLVYLLRYVAVAPALPSLRHRFSLSFSSVPFLLSSCSDVPGSNAAGTLALSVAQCAGDDAVSFINV